MRKISILAVASSVLLSACLSSDDGAGGDWNGGGGGGGGETPNASYDTLATDAEALIDKYADAAPTPAETMPTDATATYNGVAGYMVAGEPDAIMSKIALDADFGAATVAGKLDNFVTSSNEQIGGSVDINNGSITGNTLTADLDGEIDISNASDIPGTSANVSGTMDGTFHGGGAEAVLGGIDATATTNEGLPIAADGLYMAEQ